MPSLETATTSGLLTADTAIIARPAKLQTVTLIPAAADSSVIIYDNASAASGNVLLKITALANTASTTVRLTVPVEANKGLFADVSGASAAYIVHYSPL